MVKKAARDSGSIGQGGAPRSMFTRRSQLSAALDAPRTSGSVAGTATPEVVTDDVAAVAPTAGAAAAVDGGAGDCVSNVASELPNTTTAAASVIATERQLQPLSPQTSASGSPNSWASVAKPVRTAAQETSSTPDDAVQPAVPSGRDAGDLSSADTGAEAAAAGDAAAEARPTIVGVGAVSTPRNSSSYHDGPRLGELRSGPRQRLLARSPARSDHSDELSVLRELCESVVHNAVDQQEQSLLVAAEEAAERQKIKAALSDQGSRLEGLAVLVDDVSDRQLQMLRSLEKIAAAVQRGEAERHGPPSATTVQAEAVLREAAVAFKKASAQAKAAADSIWQLDDDVKLLTERSAANAAAVAKQLILLTARADSVQTTVSKVQGTVKGVQQRLDDLQGSTEANLANMQGATDVRLSGLEAELNHVQFSVEQLAQHFAAADFAMDMQRPAEQSAKKAHSRPSLHGYRSIAPDTSSYYHSPAAGPAHSGSKFDDLLRRSRSVAASIQGLKLTRKASRRHGSPPGDPSDGSSSSSSSRSTSVSADSDVRKQQGSRRRSGRKRSSRGEQQRCRSPEERSHRSISSDDRRAGHTAARRRDGEPSKSHHRESSAQRHSTRRSQQSSRRERQRSVGHERYGSGGADSATSQHEELPMIGLSSLSFAPPAAYEQDPAWCSKQLDMLWDVIVQQGAIARSAASASSSRAA